MHVSNGMDVYLMEMTRAIHILREAINVSGVDEPLDRPDQSRMEFRDRTRFL